MGYWTKAIYGHIHGKDVEITTEMEVKQEITILGMPTTIGCVNMYESEKVLGVIIHQGTYGTPYAKDSRIGLEMEDEEYIEISSTEPEVIEAYEKALKLCGNPKLENEPRWWFIPEHS